MKAINIFNLMRWNYLQLVALIILLMDYFVTVVEVKAVKADNMWLDSGVGQITRFTLDYKGIHKKSVHQTTKNFTKKKSWYFPYVIIRKSPDNSNGWVGMTRPSFRQALLVSVSVFLFGFVSDTISLFVKLKKRKQTVRR